MSINFTSKSVKLTGALKAYAEKNLKSIEAISGEIIDAEVIVSEEKLVYRVEISVKTKLNSYHIEDKDPILKQALRSALNTLKAQAKKNKEKFKVDKKRRNKEKKGFFARFLGGSSEESPETTEKSKNKKITISTNYSKKPITIEEAVYFLNESGENAYMFTNSETNKISVVFYDDSKDISIIEAN